MEGREIALIALGETSSPRQELPMERGKVCLSFCLLFPLVPRKVGISSQFAPG